MSLMTAPLLGCWVSNILSAIRHASFRAVDMLFFAGGGHRFADNSGVFDRWSASLSLLFLQAIGSLIPQRRKDSRSKSGHVHSSTALGHFIYYSLSLSSPRTYHLLLITYYLLPLTHNYFLYPEIWKQKCVSLPPDVQFQLNYDYLMEVIHKVIHFLTKAAKLERGTEEAGKWCEISITFLTLSFIEGQCW